MVSLGIKNTQNVFTNLGFILSDQSDVTVKVAEYDKDRNFKLKKQFTGSLIDLFLSGSFIKRNDFKCICAC